MTCERCGVMVLNEQVHAEFHEGLDELFFAVRQWGAVLGGRQEPELTQQMSTADIARALGAAET